MELNEIEENRNKIITLLFSDSEVSAGRAPNTVTGDPRSMLFESRGPFVIGPVRDFSQGRDYCVTGEIHYSTKYKHVVAGWIDDVQTEPTESRKPAQCASEVKNVREIKSASHPPKSIINRIIGFMSLKPGWDEYSGNPIDINAINESIQAIYNIYQIIGVNEVSSIDVEVFPISNAGVQIEIDHGNRSLEIELAPGYRGYLKVENDDQKRYTEGEIDNLDKDISSLLDWLFE